MDQMMSDFHSNFAMPPTMQAIGGPRQHQQRQMVPNMGMGGNMFGNMFGNMDSMFVCNILSFLKMILSTKTSVK